MNVLWIGKTGKANAWYHIMLTASAGSVNKVHVVRHEKPVRRVESDKVEYHLFRSCGPVPDIVKMFFRGLRVILSRKIDLIITYNVYPYGVMSYVLSVLTGKPLAVCFIGADYHTHLFQQPSRFLIQRVIKRARIVICKGRHMSAELLKAGAAEEALFYYPHFVSDEMLQRNGDGSKEFDLITISDFIPRKNLDVLVDAVTLLKDKGVIMKTCIVGAGPLYDSVKQRIQSAGLDDQIMLTGYQNDILPWLQKSRIYVQTSWGEGLSLALLEALACSLVPVVTEAGAERDLIRDGETGLFIEIGNPTDLVSKLEHLMNAGAYNRIKENLAPIRSTISIGTAREKMNLILQKSLQS